MRIGLLMLCSTGLMAVFAPPAAAQEVPPLTPGARVRVWAPELRDHKQAGTLVELRGDTLFLRAERQADTLRIPRASVTRLDVSVGRRRHAAVGALVGFLSGAGGGALAGYLIGGPGQNCDGGCGGLGALVGGAFGAGGGLLIGTIVGVSITTDRWKEVPPERVRVGFAPSETVGLPSRPRSVSDDAGASVLRGRRWPLRVRSVGVVSERVAAPVRESHFKHGLTSRR